MKLKTLFRCLTLAFSLLFGAFSGAYTGSGVPFSVGAQMSSRTGISIYFNGHQAGVGMYNRALSSSEITTLCNAGVP
jgi:hypothetical protein